MISELRETVMSMNATIEVQDRRLSQLELEVKRLNMNENNNRPRLCWCVTAHQFCEGWGIEEGEGMADHVERTCPEARYDARERVSSQKFSLDSVSRGQQVMRKLKGPGRGGEYELSFNAAEERSRTRYKPKNGHQTLTCSLSAGGM